MKAVWNGTVIAESDDTVVVEGNHYFPADSVKSQYLTMSPSNTSCPWKGTASYRHVNVDGQLNSDAAWSYEDPKQGAAEISGRIAFWKGVKVTS